MDGCVESVEREQLGECYEGVKRGGWGVLWLDCRGGTGTCGGREAYTYHVELGDVFGYKD